MHLQTCSIFCTCDFCTCATFCTCVFFVRVLAVVYKTAVILSEGMEVRCELAACGGCPASLQLFVLQLCL